MSNNGSERGRKHLHDLYLILGSRLLACSPHLLQNQGSQSPANTGARVPPYHQEAETNDDMPKAGTIHSHPGSTRDKTNTSVTVYKNRNHFVMLSSHDISFKMEWKGHSALNHCIKWKSLQLYLRKLLDGQRFRDNVMDHLRCRYRSLKRHRIDPIITLSGLTQKSFHANQ